MAFLDGLRTCRLVSFPPDEGGAGGAWMPPVDVYEAGGALVVEVELPGAGASDLQVVCEPRRLLVRGRVPPTAHQAQASVERFLLVERASGPFRCAVALPWATDPARVEARLTGGVLTVRLPRAEIPAAGLPAAGVPR